MKTLSLRTLACLAVAALAISSCKKNDSPADAPAKGLDAKMLTELLTSKAPQFEHFSIDGAAGGTITSSQGTKFNIPPNIFVTASGAPVTGPVDISIREIRDVSSMILLDKPTMTDDGRMLVSYGEFFVKAVQNKQDLGLQPKNDRGIGVQVPAKQVNGGANNEIPMWGGDTTYTYTVSGYSYINQPVSITSQRTVAKGVSWHQTQFRYALFNAANGTMDFRLDSLIKWVNCDGLVATTNPKTTVMAYFTNHFNPETGTLYSGEQPSMLFFKPKNVNTLLKFYNVIMTPPAGKEGFHSYQTTIPVGMEGTFLAISAVNGQFYAEQKSVVIGTPAAGDNYTTVSFDLQPVDAATLLTLITGMNSK
ncbi:hypothetical protein CLV51_10223 [Chitinophaga niastensis]|uniref:DUF4374 domain-containing protein n=1 Tax=Chitinophaga niastensis TaxID=536980 RepID=A0A2P8HLU6_CHINA|nr:hypothetical protein [Chitinophaga niastensis]PSL47178.1 hypothetical protein CLV51_10223 [Chitinophaga niastensis]